MRKGTIVIGGAYGDEGKGLMTDFEVNRQQSSLVVRYNGGAQAGHTVCIGNRRHVFSHVGSGAFRGAATYLGRHFIFNPFLLDKELKALAGVGVSPRIYVHPNARVTTLTDMAINAILETRRGSASHGSCGVGINETVTRHDAGFEYPVHQIFNRALWDSIRKDWSAQRMPENSNETGVENYRAMFNVPFEAILPVLENVMNHVTMGPPPLSDSPVIFEGAQGLLLDEELGDFPHVTRSKVGITSALEDAEDLGVETLQPLYVYRPYFTRHGNGPLKHEGLGLRYEDNTNVTNKWQGGLRFAPLDLQLTRNVARADLERALSLKKTLGLNVSVLPALSALTHVDQVYNQHLPVIGMDGDIRELSPLSISTLLNYTARLKYTSWGPTAEDVIPLARENP